MEYNFQADIGADIGDFMKGVKQVDAEIRDMATGVDVDIDSDIADFMIGATAVQAELDQLGRGETEVDIDANTMKAQMAIALLLAQLKVLTAKDFTVHIKAAWNNYRAVMGQIANFSRNISEVTGIMGRGGMMFLSPALIPVIASAAGYIPL